MANDRETWDVVLDDSFVDGAAHREPSAAERATAARRAHKAARKTARTVAERQRRDRRRQWLARHRRVMVVVGLLGLAVVWSRWPAPARPTVAAGVVPTSVRVDYAIPADTTLDEGVVPAVRHELDIVQRWFETQTGGKHLRLVTENQVTSVEVRHLTVTAAELRNRPDAASLVDDELRPKTTSTSSRAPDEILLSFVPVTFPEQIRCGEGSQAGFAIIPRPEVPASCTKCRRVMCLDIGFSWAGPTWACAPRIMAEADQFGSWNLQCFC